MDDLTGVNWAPSKPSAKANGQQQETRGNYYTTLRPTPPVSGRTTPSTTVAASQKSLGNTLSGSKGSTPGNDSFANLVSFNAPQSSGKNVSLQEQQRALQEKKFKEEEDRRRQFDNHFNRAFGSLSTNVSGSSTPARVASPLVSQSLQQPTQQRPLELNSDGFVNTPVGQSKSINGKDEAEEDILAAFNSSAPVDKSSHMPPVAEMKSGNTQGSLTPQNGATSLHSPMPEDDDDPFGLGAPAPAKSAGQASRPMADDDDVLGDLSKPVSEFPKPQPAAAPSPAPEKPSRPEDRAVAELVEMGFPPEKARRALESTDSGTDVQAAVGWLLNQAHEDSRKEKQARSSARRDSLNGQSSRRMANRRKSSGGSGSKPAWMKEQGRPSSSSPHGARAATKGEKDPAQLAQELGNNLFKTANSLWKTGTKKINQAVADFNNESDSSQPKWMREANGAVTAPRPRESAPIERGAARTGSSEKVTAPKSQPSVTDEAMLLESGGARPQRKQASQSQSQPFDADHTQRRPERMPPSGTDPIYSRPSPSPHSQRDPRAKLTRQAVEEESAQAYISPARRRRPAAKPEPALTVAEPDLLFNSSKPSHVPVQPAQSRPVPSATSRPTSHSALPTRPPPPKRNVPPLSPSALSQSTSARQAGTAAFKRGDYAEATTHYTTSLSQLPPTHPLTIPVLTNRTLSHLKTGDPKASIADATTVLDFIGPSRGTDESIDLGPSEGSKPMTTYWGKAKMRQAEAYEQLERWSDAASAWRACVEAGVGGSTAITGRNRCESALRPAQPQPSKPRAPAQVKPKSNPRTGQPARTTKSSLSGANAKAEAEAVTLLRAANVAASALDDEKFALSDSVDARVAAWRAGKEGNLRALLTSLENVLWKGSGWKKVGMHEVIEKGRVKVVYMRAVARVHPDKVRFPRPLLLYYLLRFTDFLFMR